MSVSGKTTVEERRPKVPTASALPSSWAPVKVKPNCGVCNKGHLTEKCFKLNGPIIQRREKLRAAGLCSQCLQPGHIAKGCARVCHKCSGRHHELLCVPASERSSGAAVVTPGDSHMTTSADDNTEPATYPMCRCLIVTQIKVNTSLVRQSHYNLLGSKCVVVGVPLRSLSCSTLVLIGLIWQMSM